MTAQSLPRTSVRRCAAPTLAAGNPRLSNDDVEGSPISKRRRHPSDRPSDRSALPGAGRLKSTSYRPDKRHCIPLCHGGAQRPEQSATAILKTDGLFAGELPASAPYRASSHHAQIEANPVIFGASPRRGECSDKTCRVAQPDLVERSVFDKLHSATPNSLVGRHGDRSCTHGAMHELEQQTTRSQQPRESFTMKLRLQALSERAV